MLADIALALSLFVVGAIGASLQPVTNWGANPTGLTMNIYIPDNRPSNPPVILVLHPCGGNAAQMFSMTRLPSYADQYGYVLIYAATTKDYNCWDIATTASLTHAGGGDSTGLAAMVTYAITTYNGDKTKVFVTGGSSGAMETNNMAGAYPDLFAGGAAYSGIAYGYIRGANSSSPVTNTPLGGVNKTGAEWLTELKRGYPGYTGAYPKMLIASGTADFVVPFSCHGEQLKQWSAAHNVSLTSTTQNSPASGWYTETYGDGSKVLSIVQQGGGHITPYQEDTMLRFWGILGTSSTTTAGATTTSAAATTSATTAPTGTCSAKYGQCGGIGWTGALCCQSGSTCTFSNNWYSQCL